jgi:hypothetical protein
VNRDVILAGCGVVLMLVGVALAATGPHRGDLSVAAEVLLGFLIVGASVGAVLKIRGSLAATGDATPDASWAAEAAFATPRPEDAATDHDLSGAAVAATVEQAASHAREVDVEEGLAVVRPLLRETLEAALVAGGRDRGAVRTAIGDGDWTDDDLAASVLSATVEAPTQSLRHRVWAWLYPERAVRRRVRHGSDAVAAAADEALPAVPGEAATRTVPVVRPTLSELQRGVDGRLQTAVDPTAIARGPLPPEPSLEPDEPPEGEPS